jgi:hypothetical protein
MLHHRLFSTTMPSKKHVPTTGEIIYKQIGRRERYKMVAVPKQSTSKRQETASTSTPAAMPSISGPAEGVDHGELNEHFQDVGNFEMEPRRTGKVGDRNVLLCTKYNE